jgi:hypothetical protein
MTRAIDGWGADLIPFEGKIDIDYLLDIPNRDIAQRALDFMNNQINEIELSKRHSYPDMQRMWKGVLRACIAHGVPLTQNQAHYAKSLGIVLPG